MVTTSTNHILVTIRFVKGMKNHELFSYKLFNGIQQNMLIVMERNLGKGCQLLFREISKHVQIILFKLRKYLIISIKVPYWITVLSY